MLDDLRYIVALVTLLTLPYAVCFWYLVHPFVGFWRRLGPVRSYTILFLLWIAVGAATWPFRHSLLAVELGTGPLLWAASALAYAMAIVVEMRCRRHLRTTVLVGVPELRPHNEGGRLLTEGIYGCIRHPRYVSVTLGTLAVALFTNYLAVWVLAVVVPLALVGVVHFEERELRARFGADYERYAAAVPRFVPRARRRP